MIFNLDNSHLDRLHICLHKTIIVQLGGVPCLSNVLANLEKKIFDEQHFLNIDRNIKKLCPTLVPSRRGPESCEKVHWSAHLLDKYHYII